MDYLHLSGNSEFEDYLHFVSKISPLFDAPDGKIMKKISKLSTTVKV